MGLSIVKVSLKGPKQFMFGHDCGNSIDLPPYESKETMKNILYEQIDLLNKGFLTLYDDHV
jgi:hypothetical protein